MCLTDKDHFIEFCKHSGMVYEFRTVFLVPLHFLYNTYICRDLTIRSMIEEQQILTFTFQFENDHLINESYNAA